MVQKIGDHERNEVGVRFRTGPLLVSDHRVAHKPQNSGEKYRGHHYGRGAPHFAGIVIGHDETIPQAEPLEQERSCLKVKITFLIIKLLYSPADKYEIRRLTKMMRNVKRKEVVMKKGWEYFDEEWDDMDGEETIYKSAEIRCLVCQQWIDSESAYCAWCGKPQ